MDYNGMMLAYIKPELLILIPILWALGTQLKKSQLKDWLIPFVLMGVSLALAFSYVLIAVGVTPMAAWVGIMQGLVIWAFEGQAYQVYKQSTDKRN